MALNCSDGTEWLMERQPWRLWKRRLFGAAAVSDGHGKCPQTGRLGSRPFHFVNAWGVFTYDFD